MPPTIAESTVILKVQTFTDLAFNNLDVSKPFAVVMDELKLYAYKSGIGWQPVGVSLEELQDIIAAMMTAGTNTSWIYDDAAGTLALNAVGMTTEEIQDQIAAALTAGTNVTINYNDAGNTLSISSTDTTRTDEEIQDVVAGLLASGSNVTITYNDVSNSLTITATGNPTGLTVDAIPSFIGYFNAWTLRHNANGNTKTDASGAFNINSNFYWNSNAYLAAVPANAYRRLEFTHLSGYYFAGFTETQDSNGTAGEQAGGGGNMRYAWVKSNVNNFFCVYENGVLKLTTAETVGTFSVEISANGTVRYYVGNALVYTSSLSATDLILYPQFTSGHYGGTVNGAGNGTSSAVSMSKLHNETTVRANNDMLVFSSARNRFEIKQTGAF